jgi:deoxyguanosine kinase
VAFWNLVFTDFSDFFNLHVILGIFTITFLGYLSINSHILNEPKKYKNPDKMYISLEGNIGAGKTTILGKLSSDPEITSKFKCIKQNLDKNWREMIPLIYSDLKRWLFTMQVAVFNAYQNPKYFTNYLITERSPWVGLNTFARLGLQKNNLTDLEFRILQDLYTNQRDPDLMIYLRLDPETCFKRAQIRARKGENKITLDYLKDLHSINQSTITNYPNLEIIQAAGKSPQELYSQIKKIIVDL